jgi:GTP-binding protein
MLIDRATIHVRAGKGGDGCVSLRREKFRPRGGPDGGDGGRGGDVHLLGDPGLDTLLRFRQQSHFSAQDGRPGSGNSRTGAAGESIDVGVPLGTVATDARSGRVLGEILRGGDRLLVVRGGTGGFGNEHFKSATNQTPRVATPGEPGGAAVLHLELRLIADVGLLGKPNAGKSTMLRAASRATPAVADYPFTTRFPHLGIAELSDGRRLVIADIPGLIEGASQGAGLGHDFLRHVERTAVLVHLLDVQPSDGTDPAENYGEVRRELALYSESLAAKPEIVVINKIDLIPPRDREARIEALRRHLGLADSTPILVASGATRYGVGELLESCWSALGRGQPPAWAAREAAI